MNIKSCLLGIVTIVVACSVSATNISQIPLQANISIKPNMVFGLDDSGSMDFEVMFQSSSGSLWWNSRTASFFSGNSPNFNLKGEDGVDGSDTWYSYSYLFPNGTASDARNYGDSTNSYSFLAIAPIPAFAFARSSDYNSLYYNPLITYKPWQPAYINGGVKTFTNTVATVARSHPALPLSGTPITHDVTQVTSSTATNATFMMAPGMVIPGATVTGIKIKSGNNWVNVTTNKTVPAGNNISASIPYFMATYYQIDATCTSGANCFSAPDGNKLRRYEIKPGNTFPSGRSYTDELQNFANWFSYQRKRKLLLASAMSEALRDIQGIRGGLVMFNNRQPVTMYDVDNTNPQQNSQYLLGLIYTNPARGLTPTIETLLYIGKQFETNTSIVQSACQYNAAFILTDGYAWRANVSTPAYSKTSYGSSQPYATTSSNTLADIALAFYTRNIRPTFPTGLLTISNADNPLNPDNNTNLHMNTYGLILGLVGTIYGKDLNTTANPYANPPTWPIPNSDQSPASIDDLWHATINGRGKMVNGHDIKTILLAIRNVLLDVLLKSGSSAPIALSNNFLKETDHTAFVTSYNQLYGDLRAYLVDLTTGSVTPGSSYIWSLRDKLTNTNPDNRVIITYNGTQGIPLRWASFNATLKDTISKEDPLYPFRSNTGTATDYTLGSFLVDYIRGIEPVSSTYSFRDRTYKLGSIVQAAPVLVKGAQARYAGTPYFNFSTSISSRPQVIYQAANDGMLHAVDPTNGNELWAYVPKLVLNTIYQFANEKFIHRFYVDATPTVADLEINSVWKTILVGGLGAGGNGFYALDITSPSSMNTEANAAAKVLWEFPNNSTAAADVTKIGMSFGKPIITKTKAAGWVVLVTSGYNNQDGKGYLFILNPQNGAILKTLSVPGTTQQEAGLTHLAAYSANPLYDEYTDYVYGGDLLGNVWRFDLSGITTADWNVAKLATLKDANNVAQPITTQPELAKVKGKRFVYVGTGALLSTADVATTQLQSFYAIIDDASLTPDVGIVRNTLVSRTISGNTITGSTADYSTKRGWYVDFSGSGERLNTNPMIALNTLFFNTNQPNASTCLSASYLYMLDLYSGTTLPQTSFTGNQTPWARKTNGTKMTSSPQIVALPNQTMAILSQNSDGTVTTVTIPLRQGSGVQNVSWREIFRK